MGATDNPADKGEYSATLIDNLSSNKFREYFASGHNIFYITYNFFQSIERTQPVKVTFRNYLKFSKPGFFAGSFRTIHRESLLSGSDK